MSSDSTLTFEVILILALILLNGVFAMSELAVVAARKTRLQRRADAGDAGARRALSLAEHPTRFLSTVQIGITLVGVFAGAYGGANIATSVAAYLAHVPALARFAEEIALALVVVVITYLSLVVGELVPKRIALNHPERIASVVAGPMHAVSVIAAPLVKVLSLSTEGMVRLLRIRKADEPPVTEEEVTALLEVGTEAGVFEAEEHEMVERVFWLGDQRVSTLMTPRHRLHWLDINDSLEAQSQELVRHRHSYYLVCDGDVDHIVGIVRMKDLLASLLEGKPLDLKSSLRKPLYVPESLRALRMLELFRESGVHLAVVIDEYGGVEGLVTMNDVLAQITGEMAGPSEGMVQRGDGSWLVDGALHMDDFWEGLGLEERRSDGRQEYRTLAGLIVTELGRIPSSGDSFQSHGLRFEVVDMDGHRVDKVLVSRVENGQMTS